MQYISDKCKKPMDISCLRSFLDASLIRTFSANVENIECVSLSLSHTLFFDFFNALFWHPKINETQITIERRSQWQYIVRI